MKIGVIGAGNMGRALAVRFATANHEVMLSNSRGPATLVGVVASIRGDVRPGTLAEAAGFGAIVALAIPFGAVQDLPPEPFTGKLVVDASNSYHQPPGRFPDLDTDQTTSSEQLASLLPAATVVKAFNTIFFQRLLDDSRPGLPAEERLAIPVCGDDPSAKRTVIALIDQIGFAGVDAGPLANGRHQQPGTVVYSAFAQARAAGATLTASQTRKLLDTS
jgi:8-hydroxy-5-deazaflavin:NADPH oxidoreductase